MEHGIENSLQIVVGSAHLGNVAGAVLEDGKITFGDIGQLRKAMNAVNGIAGADFGEAVKEWGDWDEGERETLCATFAKEFDVPQDKVEGVAEQIVCLAIELSGSLMKISDVIKALLAK